MTGFALPDFRHQKKDADPFLWRIDRTLSENKKKIDKVVNLYQLFYFFKLFNDNFCCHLLSKMLGLQCFQNNSNFIGKY